MNGPKTKTLGGRPLGQRQSVKVARDVLVRFAPLSAERPLPILAEPAVEGVQLASWIAAHRAEVDAHLESTGGVLFRGFGLASEADFQQVLAAFAVDLLEYSYRSTPRTQVSGRVYTSTEYPADQPIPMHNEMSYSSRWPLKIFFFSAKTAEAGGETPIADSRRVYQRLDPALRRRFEERGVLYRRNYGPRIDLPWQEVFQTSDRSEVERICADLGIVCRFEDDEHLVTTQVCQAVARHPRTGEAVWFNQAHLFHVSSLDPAVRDTFLAHFGEDGLPRNTYYGDGTPLEADALAQIRQVYEEESVVFPWQTGDLLLLDNMLTAHGRRPFRGSRRVLVGMAESMSAPVPVPGAAP